MIKVEVVYGAAPHDVDRVDLELADGACVADAVRASGIADRRGLDAAALMWGVWGRRCEADTALRDRDRVEIYRPLQCDPKEARRLRYRKQADRDKDRPRRRGGGVSGNPPR
jgi:hypothetical protein